MGRQVLLAVISCLALSEASGETAKTVNSSLIDNVSAESAPRLYNNIPFGVYASAAPYGAFSFHTPVISTPHSSQLASNTQNVIHHNGYLNSLKDSYGKFVQAPQAYKTGFPQQYVQIQELPAHLTQPLVAVAPSYHYKQSTPHFFFGPQQYRVPSLHQATPTPLTSFSGFSQPLVYAQNTRNFAPSSAYHQVHSYPTQQQSGSKASSTNAPNTTFQRLQSEPQKQRANESKKESNPANKDHGDSGQIQASPAQTSVTAIVNGEKTVITLDTKPPLPLLDLSLLEPLTFANPLVPQVQHYLPKINSATYYKLPQFNSNTAKKNQKEIIVHKTNTYDSGPSKAKPHYNEAPKKKPQPHKPQPQAPAKPSIKVNGSPNGDEFSYEINTPNHKETYNEQVVSYNKQTNMKPIEFNYNEQSTKEPINYSFSHNSKEPLQIKHVEYESDPNNPKQLIYKFTPGAQGEQHDEVQLPPAESDQSGESEEEDEVPAQPQPFQHQKHDGKSTGHHDKSPGHHDKSRGHYDKYPDHHDSHYVIHQQGPRYSQHSDHHGHEAPRNSQQHHLHTHHEETPKLLKNYNDHNEKSPHLLHQYGHHEQTSTYSKPHNEAPRHHQQSPRNSHSHHEETPKSYQHHNQHSNHPESPRTTHYTSGYYGGSSKPTNHQEETPKLSYPHSKYHETPRQSHHLKPEHREAEHHHNPKQGNHGIVHSTPHYFSQPLTVSLQNAFHSITPQYEEDIRILPTHAPHFAHIKLDSNQHVQLESSTPRHNNAYPSPAPQKLPQQHQSHEFNSHQSRPYSTSLPQILEKSNHFIIQEKEETPDGMYEHAERLMAQMIEKEENNEEDFEKAYKESAFGFPAYEQSVDVEKDIYSPETYGEPNHDSSKDHALFQQYQEEGDEFPKSSRLTYSDAKDSTKEDYFLDYSISKPESLTDRYRKKVDYYKDYKKYRPAKLFDHSAKKQQKEKEKYIAEPSYAFSPSKPKQKQYYAQYKVAPQKYEYDYLKEAPRDSDSSAFASHSGPHHKFRTNFVEPQFQYGFEPVAAPLVLDSELAAMASNHSPESEKPGTRKKVYKENWYIKKTSTTGGDPS